MAKLQLQIVTAERQVLEEEADMVIAPGGAGELGILPRHIPLITTLNPGELRVRENNDEHVYAIAGGFMEVRHAEVANAPGSQVIILADAAERADEIDLERAQEARRRAEEALSSQAADTDLVVAQASLLRAIARIRVAERQRGRRQHG